MATDVTTRRLALYESAMCCETGVCGPSVDQKLIDIREDLRWAEEQGATVARHNLGSDPDAFVAAPKVTTLMQVSGEQALPVLLVDDEVLISGRYPSREELGRILGTAAPAPAELPQAGGCSPSSGCC